MPYRKEWTDEEERHVAEYNADPQRKYDIKWYAEYKVMVAGGDPTEMTAALADLATRINVEHEAVGVALRTALGHALAAGKLLNAAKRRVGHGDWGWWLLHNCKEIPPRTARHYMRLYRLRKKLLDQNGNVLPLSVRDALDRLKHSDGSLAGRYDEWADYRIGWSRLAWREFAVSLRAALRLTYPVFAPKAEIVVEAVRAGKCPGLTAEALHAVIVLLARYAKALEALEVVEPEPDAVTKGVV